MFYQKWKLYTSPTKQSCQGLLFPVLLGVPQGALRNIHRRVGTAVLFESSGGQVDKVAHLPELRFALGEPDVDTTTIDNAATVLERSGFFIRKVGTDGLSHPVLCQNSALLK